MTKIYLENIFNTFHKGDAREESYYHVLKSFLSGYSQKKRNKKIDITVLPKKTEAGNPDFRIWDGSQRITGYIEAKDLATDLDRIEDTEQITRYLSTFPNVILTNFTEFRLYRQGEMIDKVSVTRPFVIKKLATLPPLENEDKLFALLDRFLDFSLPKTFSAKTLATELAKRTKFLKDEIVAEELKSNNKSIIGFYEVFKEFLIAGISEEEFADLYSQTITYGLFAARLRAKDDFSRKLAYSFIPKSIGILRDIFKYISLEDIPLQMEIIIDDIAEVLLVADAKKILDQYYHEGKGSDPVLHFYETFLSVYDPATREKRGVYYTPEPVVSFIVRSLHEILEDKFNKTYGLADKGVTLLDPAGGTLGFLAKAIETAVEDYSKKYGAGVVQKLIKGHILQNFYSFELMMAPYAIGHMKMSFLLEELGYQMEDDERIKYYLTNTLDMEELQESKFPGMSSLSHESHEAGKVKKEAPILVVLGNPPYSGHSSNTGEWISNEIKEYYKVDGKPLGEKNPKWLQDDYVKFIRFAQWKIDQAGEGILGFITNHSYLDNPTFRGMRQSLMTSFDEIYILDLHGNSLKKEKTPEGGKDENVFDIQQGVAIAFFLKYKEGRKKLVARHEIFGLREEKYSWLNKHSFRKVKWEKVVPHPDFYLFIQTDNELAKHYYSFMKITDIFPVNSVGIVTSRDNFVIDFDRKKLEQRIRQFRDSGIDDETIKITYNLAENQSWKIKEQREKLRKDQDWKDKITKILYRPFDERWILYHDDMIERARREVMQHMLQKNLAICVGRQFSVIGSNNYNIVFLSERLVDLNLYRRGGELVFPLYLYPEKTEKRKSSHIQMMIFEPEVEYKVPKPNIKPELIEELKGRFKRKVTPEDIFYYIYGVLFSNTYRTKYLEFLKTDFPRIPFTKSYELFVKIGRLGKQLAEFHLLKSPALKRGVARYPIPGTDKIEKIYYEDEKIWINKQQYFTGVKKEIWEYKIGGYPICEKWLKERKGRAFNMDDLTSYLWIISSLSKTIELQKEIDKYYEEVEKSLTGE